MPGRVSATSLSSLPSKFWSRVAAAPAPDTADASAAMSPGRNGRSVPERRPTWAQNFTARWRPVSNEGNEAGNTGQARSASSSGVKPPAETARPAEQFFRDQRNRRHDANHAPVTGRLREKIVGIATLSSCSAPVAVQVDNGHWSQDAATELVRALHWEQQRLAAANIDLVELAHAIACAERWRAEGKPELRDAAIEALLAALSLGGQLDLETLREGYAAGAVGYEHKGKSIWSGYLSHLSACAMLASLESATAAAAMRGGMSLAQAYFELNSGNDRLRRKPQEELAAALHLDVAARAASAPGMGEAAALARDLHAAADLAARLRQALDHARDEAGKAALAALLKEAEETVFAGEGSVKARLDIFSENWSARWREVLTRSSSAAVVTGGAIASAVVPPAAPAILPACVAGAAGLQMYFRIRDWDGTGLSNSRMRQLFNFIRNADWIDRRKLTPAGIASLYQAFEAGTMSRDALRQELAASGAFDLQQLGDRIVLPVTLRMSMADVLLRGKLAEAIDRQLAGDTGAKDLKHDPALQTRRLLADLFNLQRAVELTRAAGGGMDGDDEARERALSAASRFLHAVQDPETRDLFARDMKAQTRAATHALTLRKGTADAFRYSLGAGAAAGVAAGPVYGLIGDGVKTARIEDGSPAGTGFAAALAAGGIGSTVPAALCVGTLAGRAYGRHRASQAAGGATGAALPDPVTIRLRAGDSPLVPARLPRDTVSSLLRAGSVPGAIAFEWEDDGKTGRQTGMLAELADTQPYYHGQRRALGASGRAKAAWGKAVAGAADALESASEPVRRTAVAFWMRKTRTDRRELHKLANQAATAMRGGSADGEPKPSTSPAPAPAP